MVSIFVFGECLRIRDMMKRVIFFVFLASEVIDESVITVVVVPEDPHIPCMLFKSEKEKFYFILFYFMIR